MQFWQKTKRNHGLEHATISLLLARVPHDKTMAGYSVSSGFVVLGNVTTEQVREQAEIGLARMKAGETELAISPFCGTNIVVGAGLATLGTLAGYRLAGRGFPGISRAFSNAVFAIVASRPLGRLAQQRYTTSADVEMMTIKDVTPHHLGKLTLHWVKTEFDD